ncbi:two-partner secretion domain-containing protein [Massilia antarctica]|uniref:two-partner secretion domain-containing protein n=1 Tax=Massilia antarctica TaxID=2765360 RepID=UPI0006BE0119|nr:filamentous hemagglutinin N-terminal domain-containing protein [Massilia sp. H27-R4]MCY0911633.1 filamentous hemagglutinin N-terminal domain-containing protein [Massilia sp. H27-R4]CUI04744.1 Adhesin [Janthinobacterium sp. CG23_2]CUU28530.1 Adhesin [Janthinobacterium sp. CG23_2]
MTIQNQFPRLLKRPCLSLALPLLLAFGVPASAASPGSPQVVAGQATFGQQGNVFSITNTPNTIINWQSFSVAAGDITRFIQQDANSAVLNRITGQDPSRILGALQSNGQVFLINPNGILFGRDARIDVGGLAASTLNLSNADFLAGKRNFNGSPTAGAIVNQGAITTPGGGKVFLIAPNVENSGIITSPQGEVVLAAGHSVQLVDSGNPDLHVVVSAPASAALNLGQVIAQGGKIGIYGALVRQRGLVSANSAQVGANGKIVFKASADALLEAGSVTSATGAGKGGEITVQGERVGLTGDSRIDASGAAGGGTVLVGGGYQGKNALLRNAQQTVMGKAASIRADATGSGDGGTVVLWSDGATRAFGSISATGGKGGRVETSGHYLDVNGIRVNTGARGTWLLDPYDVTIGANGSTDLLDTVDEFVDTPANTMSLIDSAMLNSAAPAADIVIQARHDVLVNGAITRPAVSTGKLSVEAGNNISIDAPITTSGGALTLSANVAPYASGTGTVAINGALDTGGGNLSLSGQNVRIGNTGSAPVNVGNGYTAISAVDTFQLAANATLQSGGAIDIVADNITMPGGMIGPALSQRPVVSIAPYTSNRDIVVASGAPMVGVLQLSPFDLNPIHAQELSLGGPGYGGKIGVYAPLGGQSTPAEMSLLRLHTTGNIDVNAPIELLAGAGTKLSLERFGGGAGLINTSSSATLSADLVLLASDNINIGATITGSGSNGGVVVLSPGNPTTIIHLGDNALDATGRLGLNTSELTKIFTRQLIIGGELAQTGAVDINGALDLSASLAPGSKLVIKAGDGAINLLNPITTPGALLLNAASVGNSSTAPARAAAIGIQTRQQTGSASTPFYTQTAFLTASNSVESSNGPINISNTGTLDLGSVTQNGAGNMGAIMIANAGGMTVLKDGPSSASPVIVSSLGGPVTLSTQSPLTINGTVASNGGAIGLQAGNGGVLTIGTSGTVASGAGNISMVAGAVVNDGSVSATSGNISLSAASVSGSGTIASTSGAVSGVPGKVPTVDACIATPTLAGCATVLADAVSACTANPALSYCAAVLPSLDACTANPATPGCTVVLPTLSQCVATPTAPGCKVVLPTLAACISAPSTAGCGVVLPTLAVCVSAPSTPGCEAVLPTLAQCVVNPAQSGCLQVLPSLTTCIAAPATNGCTAVLPTLSACLATPSRAGCVAVLPTLAACVANPTQAGCSVVLPSLAACSASPGLPGCSAVLPSVAQCVAAPTQAGCAAVLPTLTQCISATSLPGCSVVLPSLSRCVANPATPGCAVVLPSLSQCVANPGASGCSVVLPTLAQCAANAAVPGCNAVLPTLNQCVGNAALPGCGAVLPSLQSCVANPGAPGCSAVLPTLAQCTVTPSLAACNVVLPSVAQCAAAPGLAGCVAVLPPLAQCVATPSAPGCAVVLPGLSQCVATPSAAGCSAVLPTVAQCVGSPGLQGCAVVLPPVNTCVANPALPGCAVVAPPQQLADDVVKEVIVNTVNVVNSVTPSDDGKAPEKKMGKEEGVKTADTSTVKGDASELRKKTYCN